MVVRKEVCLTQSEWYVMDCLWAYAPQTVMQLATDLSQRAGWAKSTTITTLEQMEAKGLVRSTPVGRDTQYHPCVRREEAAKSEVCSFLDRIYRGSVGLMVSAMADGRQAIQQRVARLGKGDRPQKAALAAVAVLLTLAAVLAFGGGPPSPYSYAGYAAAVEGARSIHLTAPPVSSAGYPPIEEEGALEEARSLLLQAVEYDDSRDATAFGFSDMAPYSYQLALSMREDWMYFYLYPSSNGPVYVLPYLDGAASGAVPVAALPSSTISQLLRLSAQSPSIQTQDDLLSAIRQADAVQCCKGRAYSSTAPLISSPEARAQLVTLLSGGGHPTDSVNFDPDTVPFLRISGGPGDGAVFYLAEQERNCCLILAQENGPLPLALLPSGTAQWVQELSWLQDLSTVAAQAHSFAAYFGSLTGRYASIRDADLVEEVRQLLSSSNPQDGTLDPVELYYDSCLIFCGEGDGELGRLSLSSREMCHALVQISDRQEDRDRAA